ncbi:hypothetical protein IAG44_23725 [Streptomyces roseirectus]|uniref:DUF5602 domain-containing protein n=1 Tax=Streptomyces roseirectus TaxID=2768066 RepID=A0A7H0IH57_9ACTN|nr:hypothetical protein [Streptomyces roseirectus]QNP72123.1 hypothetical protein IAG44_23725 [Streptomyces roseirectus]
MPRESVDAVLRSTASYTGPCAEYGSPVRLGDGVLRAYEQRAGERPVALGVVFSAAALRGLPSAVSDEKHCFDKDGNGGIDPHTECSAGHENVLQQPTATKSPFTWDLVNWNPQGHVPKGVYDVPHFDFHFYLQPLAQRDAIRPGPCPMLTDCADYARAKKPVPERYLAPGFIDVDAVEPAMGNHLLDSASPELNGAPFTHTWIYGTYDGEITFYESMIAKSWLEGLRDGTVADTCVPFRQPSAWLRTGWYPTRYCAEYRENRGEYTVSLTGFTYRRGT